MGDRLRSLAGRAPWLFALLAMSGPAPLRAQDQVFRAPRVEVDGNLAEWQAWPFELYGLGSSTEDLLRAHVCTAWSPEGLFIALHVLCPPEKAENAIAPEPNFEADFYAESSGPKAGRVHAVVCPFGERGIFVVDDRRMADRSTWRPVVGFKLASRRLPDGFDLECFVPWSAVRLEGVLPGARPRWLLRLRAMRGNNVLQARSRLDVTADEEPAAGGPARLPWFVAAEEIPAIPAVQARELVVQGAAFVRLELLERGAVPHRWRVLGFPAGVVAAETDVVSSLIASGDYTAATLDLPVATDRGCPASVSLRVVDPATGAWRGLSVPVPAAQRLARIGTDFERIVAAAPVRQRELVSLLADCAREAAAATEASAESGARADRRIAEIFTWAEAVAARDPAPAFIPIQAWRDETDGLVRPVRIIHPWNFQPGRLYPARVLIYGKNVRRGRLQFLEEDLRGWYAGQFHPFAGDHFTVVYFDASNDDEELEQLSLRHLFTRLVKELPIDPARVGISGGSLGAHQALDVALRHPQRFAWAAGRAGSYGVPLDSGTAEAREKFLGNLRATPVFLSAGEKEQESSVRFLAALRKSDLSGQLEVVANATHHFAPPSPPTEVVEHRLARYPAHLAVATRSPDYGVAAWLCVDGIENWGQLAEAEGTVSADGIVVESHNVDRLRIDPARLDPALLPLRVRWNGRDVGGVTAAAEARFVTGGAASADANALWKGPGRSGPAKRIEWAPTVIVYGTRDPHTAFALRERAGAIVRARVGLEDGQRRLGAFTIAADRDCSWETLRGRNVWLIGSPAENALLAADDRYRSVVARVLARVRGDADLVSFIYPQSGDSARYVYFDVGRRPGAYALNILAAPSQDVCAQTRLSDGSVVGNALTFDSRWELP